MIGYCSSFGFKKEREKLNFKYRIRVFKGKSFNLICIILILYYLV